MFILNDNLKINNALVARTYEAFFLSKTSLGVHLILCHLDIINIMSFQQLHTYTLTQLHMHTYTFAQLHTYTIAHLHTYTLYTVSFLTRNTCMQQPLAIA